MKIKTMHNNIKKATIEMILLKLLSEGDKYGYQMSQECKRRSGGKYSILEGSMYPILYRLEESNFISSYEKKVGRRLTRVYYHIEDGGLNHLSDMINEFHSAVNLVDTLLTSQADDEEEFE